jgi:hypothetical protein
MMFMKKIAFVFAIAAAMFASCSNYKETVRADPEETGYNTHHLDLDPAYPTPGHQNRD